MPEFIPFDPHHPSARRFLVNTNTRWKMWLFFIWRLPTLAWWGVRVRSCTAQRAVTAIPYGWRTQNPFRSTYFAAQAGAAELSTGLLAMLAIEGRGQVSMLVTGLEAEFVKKATSTVSFICEEGADITAAVDRALALQEAQTLRVSTIGTQENGEVVSRFWVTWSFRAKR